MYKEGTLKQYPAYGPPSLNWSDNISHLTVCMRSLSVRDYMGAEIPPVEGFCRWRDCTLMIRDSGKTVYLIGNGASASMASHMAADLAKNARIHTEIFTDPSLITAIANDLSYEEVFSEPLRRRMNPGDMLVTLSSSGQSKNILRASRIAIELGGFLTTLSAMKPDNPLRSEGALNFYVPADSYGAAETCHAAILHHWMDLMSEVAN